MEGGRGRGGERECVTWEQNRTAVDRRAAGADVRSCCCYVCVLAADLLETWETQVWSTSCDNSTGLEQHVEVFSFMWNSSQTVLTLRSSSWPPLTLRRTCEVKTLSLDQFIMTSSQKSYRKQGGRAFSWLQGPAPPSQKKPTAPDGPSRPLWFP